MSGMLFRVKNLGLIDEAEIKLDGITVITGENNTGKSTIGRMLYCVNNVFVDGNIEAMKAKRLQRVIVYSALEIAPPMQSIRKIEELISDSGAIKIILNKEASVKEALSPILLEFFGEAKDSHVELLESKILEISDMSDQAVLSVLFDMVKDINFSGKVHNIYSENQLTEIELEFINPDQYVEINVDQDLINVSYENVVFEEAIYIDSPHIMRDKDRESIGSDFFLNMGNRLRLLQLLVDDSKVDFLLKQEISLEIKKIFDKISEVAPGNLVKKDDFSNRLEYEEFGHRFDLINVSSGIKTFAILKKLLLNAKLKRNGMLILDEPEIHLHPEWQLTFAEILVLLKKQFNLKIIINTHSFYFLAAIEDYSKIHEIDQSCNYYLVERKENHSSVSDHTNTLNEIYLRFSEPMDELENQVR